MMNQVRQPLTLESLRARRDEIVTLAQRRGADNVRVFGSVARGEATPESDVDFIVDFETGASLVDQSGLWLDLIELLNVNVDVVSNHPRLTERFRRQIEREAVWL